MNGEGGAPTYPTALLGVREWQLSRVLTPEGIPCSELALASVGRGRTLWRPAPFQSAECKLGGEHSAPDPECECGLYAYYCELDRHQRWWISRSSVSDGRVWGVVAARGQTQLHQEGFRAEQMRLVALVAPADLEFPDLAERTYEPEELRSLARAWGVPLLENSTQLRKWLRQRPELGDPEIPSQAPQPPWRQRARGVIREALDRSTLWILAALIVSATVATLTVLFVAAAAVAVIGSSAGEGSWHPVGSTLSLLDSVKAVVIFYVGIFCVSIASSCASELSERRFRTRQRRKVRAGDTRSAQIETS